MSLPAPPTFVDDTTATNAVAEPVENVVFDDRPQDEDFVTQADLDAIVANIVSNTDQSEHDDKSLTHIEWLQRETIKMIRLELNFAARTAAAQHQQHQYQQNYHKGKGFKGRGRGGRGRGGERGGVVAQH